LLTSTGEPKNISQALTDTNWKSAMQEEHNALLANNTWHLVPLVPNTMLLVANWSIVSRKMLMVL
jgi:hypothetical protein